MIIETRPIIDGYNKVCIVKERLEPSDIAQLYLNGVHHYDILGYVMFAPFYGHFTDNDSIAFKCYCEHYSESINNLYVSRLAAGCQ